MGQIVSENYFEVFGLPPAAGRFFAPDESVGAPPVAVISHALWQSLGGTEAVLGQHLRVNNHVLSVIGVAAAGFRGPMGAVATEVWLPLALQPMVAPDGDLDQRGFSWLEVVGRLATGVSREQAAASLAARHQQLASAYPDLLSPEGSVMLDAFGTVPGQMRGGVGAFVAILMGLVGLLLLITCINVAGMLLARAIERRREMAMRLAIGAGRGRLVRQLVTESLLLFLLGGVAGTLLAHGAVRLFLAVDLPLPVPLALDISIDPRVLVFTLAVTLGTGILFGLTPALQSTRLDLISTLREEGSGDSPRRLRLRGAFVVAQVATSLVLLIAAGLLIRSFQHAAAIDPGFDPEGVHLATLDLSLHGYDEAAGQDFYRRLGTRLRALPGVEAASLAKVVPLNLSNSTTGFNVPAHQPPPDEVAYPADTNTIDVVYFRTMGIALVSGRGFAPRDQTSGQGVVVINQHLADHFWPGRSAVGQSIQLGGPESPAVEVVGVAPVGKYRTLGEDPRFFIYRPLSQRYAPRMTVHLRGQAGIEGLPQALRHEIRALDPHLPVASAMTLDEAIRVALLPQRVASIATTSFGLLGLLLAGIGIYGVSAFSINQRTRELGVRMAVGARGRDLLTLVMRQGVRLASVGIAIGLLAAWALTRLGQGLLHGISATDPWIFGAMALAMTGVVILGNLVPALRAARIDPLRALRHG
jgi:predicted permease